MTINRSFDRAAFADEPDLADEWPFCECDEQTTEGEEIDNRCASCGKSLGLDIERAP